MDDNHLAGQMPQTIGRYQVQESIGFGAMGAVYKAFDPLIKRTLAIKTIRLDIPRQSPQYKSFIERFYHEARISGTLSHPNIVTLFDIGEEGGLPYLAMEYVEGETIASLLERGVRFKPEKVIGLVSQIASAMDYAHSKGVIHRDIKPSNLILYETDRVKVTDFGIAKLVDAEMTQSGTLLGTPSYMSPEQAMGDKLDGRSDIFSLGVCAFEMLAGEQPFPGNNVTSILYKLVHVDPIEPANLEMNGLVPEKWHEVFSRVLAKKPDDRYQTASEFVQDLEYCLGAWFGAAMGDEVPGEPAGATAVMPAVTAGRPASPPAAPVPPPVPGRTAAPASAGGVTEPLPILADEEESATVVMRGPTAVAAAPPAEPPEPTEEKTIVMKAPKAPTAAAKLAPPPPARGKRPAAPPPVESEPQEEKTILLKAPAPSGPPHPAGGGRPAAPPPPPRPATPPPVSAGEDDEQPKTILMKAPPGPPAAPAPAAPEAAAPEAVAPEAVAPEAVAPARPSPRSSSLPLILAGVGLLLFVVVALTGFLVWRKFTAPQPVASEAPTTTVAAAPSPVTASTEPLTAPATGTLHVESQPAGAAVTLDGEAKGVTPLDIPDLPLATYQVAVDLKGYAPATQAVTLDADHLQSSVTLALSRTAPATGGAEVFSDPSGATVRIDGVPGGQTPFAEQKLRVGSHRVELTKDGYEPWSGTVTVAAGRRARLDATLKAIPKASPTPAPDVVDANRVYAENEVDTPPKKVGGRSAEYPSAAPALKRGQRASVTIAFVVTETGDVTDAQVVESGGSALDQAVLSAFKTWTFTPAVKHGTKVKVKLTRRHTFLGG